MLRSGMQIRSRAEAAPGASLQTIAVTRFLATSSIEILELTAQAALANPALDVAFELEPEPRMHANRHRSTIPPLARLDDAAQETQSPSLYEHVARQLPLLVRDGRLHIVAHAWLEGLEPSGWVSLAAHEVAAKCLVSVECAEHVLGLMQSAEPNGLFGRTLRECLSIQLQALDEMTPQMECLLANLPLLASGNLRKISEKTGLPDQMLPQLIARLRRLDPKPGAQFQTAHMMLPAPDFVLERIQGTGWDLRRGRWLRPTLKITDPKARKLAGDLRAAAMHVALVENRDRLIYRAAVQAVSLQSRFLDGAIDYLRPMSLADVAGRLEVHDTTIGRIRKHVVIGDGAGAILLRDLFTPAIPTADGHAISPRELSARIREIGAALTTSGRISDEAIRNELHRQGVMISRRTVTKYRRGDS